MYRGAASSSDIGCGKENNADNISDNSFAQSELEKTTYVGIST